MRMFVVVDERGRITIPSEVRKKLGIAHGTVLELRVKEGEIILRPIASIAERAFGKYKVKAWPRDLDEFVVEAIRRWWSEATST